MTENREYGIIIKPSKSPEEREQRRQEWVNEMREFLGQKQLEWERKVLKTLMEGSQSESEQTRSKRHPKASEIFPEPTHAFYSEETAGELAAKKAADGLEGNSERLSEELLKRYEGGGYFNARELSGSIESAQEFGRKMAEHIEKVVVEHVFGDGEQDGEEEQPAKRGVSPIAKEMLNSKTSREEMHGYVINGITASLGIPQMILLPPGSMENVAQAKSDEETHRAMTFRAMRDFGVPIMETRHMLMTDTGKIPPRVRVVRRKKFRAGRSGWVAVAVVVMALWIAVLSAL
ncbi:hypothetical protein [Thalassoglobus neptunius]|nr:hypothetical protein [Thalassoglobus neptunius]